MTGRDALPPASPPPLPPPAPLLPPCRVCGAEASGFHYGLNTCEACKGFFRRAVARKDKLVCSLEGRCNVVNGNRSACAACRWEKCVQLGMSKTAYKRGRYTYEKKAADIREVKALQQRQAETQTDDCAE